MVLVHMHAFADEGWYTPVMQHLDIGVTIFFVLSGFLLYRPLVAARILDAPRARTADYARRRFLRVVPAYWLALTVLAVALGIGGVFTENWWVYYGFLQNYPIYTATPDCAAELLNCGIEPAWSLGVEVAFYATLPLFALGMDRLAGRSRGGAWVAVEAIVLGLIAIVSIPLIAAITGELDQWLYFSPLGHGLWFALGMGLAVLSVRTEETGSETKPLRWLSRRPVVPWVGAVAIYALACATVEPGGLQTDAELRFVLFGLASALVVLPAVLAHGPGLPRRVLAAPWLAWLGLISYGIFLWHLPIGYALWEAGVADWVPALGLPVITALTLAITIACAAGSYYAVERPLMRLKYRRGDRRRPAGAGAVGR